MIKEFVTQYAERRVRAIDAECWRMIADGCLFSKGWALAVYDEIDGTRFKFTIVRMPPGVRTLTLPAGVSSYQLIGA